MIRVYEPIYNPDGLIELISNQTTGYGKGFTADDLENVVQILKTTFVPHIKADDYGYMVVCDNKKTVIGLFVTTCGGGMTVKYNARRLLTKALLCNATHIILARNAPNKDYTISESEIGYYQSFKQTAGAVGIAVIDNLILIGDGYISFKQQGIR